MKNMLKQILITLVVATLIGSLLGGTGAVYFNNVKAAVPPSLNNNPEDEPTITVKNVTKGVSVYDNNATADPTDKLRFRVWVHNTSKPEENAPAHNVKVQVVLSQSSDKKTLTAKAYLSADDAHPASGESKVTSNSEFNYSFVSNSTLMYGKDENNNQINGKQMGDGIVASGINIGTIKGCWEWIHQISFEVQLSQVQPQNPTLSVDKKVVYNGTEYDSVSSGTHRYGENESVQYRVYVKNTGNATINNAQYSDQLPSYINWTSGDGSYDSGANKVNLSLGDINAGNTKTVNYMAKVKSGIPTGETSQTNTVTVTTNNAGSQSDSATVVIYKQESQNLQLSVNKKVLWNGSEYDTLEPGTKKFGEGETFQYKVYIQNTGNAQINNVQLTDQLPTYINWTSGDGSYDSGANRVNSSLGNMGVNETKTVTYTVKVKSGIPTGDTTQTNNVNVSSDNAGSRSDSTTVTITKTPQVLSATTVTQIPQTGASEFVIFSLLALLPLGLKLRKFALK